MYDGSLTHSGLNASFESGELPAIRFFDPAYVRSEKIIFDRNNGSVHAVLHENMILIGSVPEDLVDSFGSHEEVLLSAAHYAGKEVCLKAKISVL